MTTKKIIQLRKMAGLTQQDMADKMNKSVSSYNRLERGETQMTIGDVEKISEILRIPAAEILRYLRIDKPVQLHERPAPAEKAPMEKLLDEIHEIKVILQKMKHS